MLTGSCPYWQMAGALTVRTRDSQGVMNTVTRIGLYALTKACTWTTGNCQAFGVFEFCGPSFKTGQAEKIMDAAKWKTQTGITTN
jgi:hypothetical protein